LRAVSGQWYQAELEIQIEIGVLTQRHLRDHTATKSYGAELESLVIPEVIMLKCPDQKIHVSGVDISANQDPLANDIVDNLPPRSKRQVSPKCEIIKKLSRSLFKRIPVIKLQGEHFVCGPRPEFSTVIYNVWPRRERHVERFFVINLF